MLRSNWKLRPLSLSSVSFVRRWQPCSWYTSTWFIETILNMYQSFSLLLFVTNKENVIYSIRTHTVITFVYTPKLQLMFCKELSQGRWLFISEHEFRANYKIRNLIEYKSRENHKIGNLIAWLRYQTTKLFRNGAASHNPTQSVTKTLNTHTQNHAIFADRFGLVRLLCQLIMASVYEHFLWAGP